ncbi:MAG: nuclear transport factor 2 family protein [Pseudomonadota bacterium]
MLHATKSAALGLALTTSTISGFASENAPDIPLRSPCSVPGAAALQTRSQEFSESEQEIMNLERLSCRMLGNPETVATALEFIVADDGMVLLDGAGIAGSRMEQSNMFKAFFDAGYDVVYEPVDARVSASHDMAWAIGLVKVTEPNGAYDIGKYVSIWHRVDGVWKNAVEMRNSNGGVVVTR